MSAMALLVGLLVVAYLGNLLMSGRALRGYGLPSGSEWLLLGFVLGPSVLGAASTQALASFEPLLGIATAWLALVLGAEYGYAGDRRAGLRGFVAGILCALVSLAIVSAIVFLSATRLLHVPRTDSVYLALAIGLASCETARYAVQWVVEHAHPSSSLVRLIEDIADTDEVVPVLGLGLLFVLSPSETTVTLSAAHWLAITAGLGVLLGLVCSMLLRGFARAETAWGVLLGGAWLATGIAWRLGVSALSSLFLLGVTLCATSRHGPALRRMLARSEPAVLLPTLLLAGALVTVPRDAKSALVIVTAVLARGLARCAIGGGLASVTDAPRGARLPLALGFWSTGALTTLVATACFLRFRGPLGDTILAACCAMTVVGEVVGPLSLRRALSSLKPAPRAPGEPEAAS